VRALNPRSPVLRKFVCGKQKAPRRYVGSQRLQVVDMDKYAELAQIHFREELADPRFHIEEDKMLEEAPSTRQAMTFSVF
jgi:hypothetical protein